MGRISRKKGPESSGQNASIAHRGLSPRVHQIRDRFLVAGLVFGLVLTVAIVHAPAVNARALAFDDSQYLVKNRLVRNPSWQNAKRFLAEVLEPSTVGGYYQPLTMISLMLDHAAGGRPDDLRVFHRTSLILHAINAGLVLILLYMLFGRVWPAATAALLFGLHPLTVEPIPWVGERKTLLAACFALLSLIAYVRYAPRAGWMAYVLCFVGYLLALMAKPTSTPLPLVMLLMDFWPLRRLSKRGFFEKLPLFALGAAFAVITVVSQGRTAHLTMPTEHSLLRIPLLLCHNIVFYPLKILCPIHLTPHYPLPEPLTIAADPMALVGVIGTCILLPLLLISLRRTRALATGWMIFFVMLLPATGIIGFTIVIASDKYAYLPAIGLLMILTWALALLADRIARSPHRPLGVAAMVVVVGLVATAESVATRRQIDRWRDTEVLYRYMLDLAPRSARLHTILGDILSERGLAAEAIAAHRRALELRPDFPEALNNLGPLLAEQNDLAGAEKCFRESLRIWPDNPIALSNLGMILARRGDLHGAAGLFEQSLRLQRNSSETCNNLATVFMQLGRIPEALPHYRRAIELDPENTQARYNLGIALEQQGDPTGAATQYRTILRQNPGHDAARLRLNALATRPAGRR